MDGATQRPVSVVALERVTVAEGFARKAMLLAELNDGTFVLTTRRRVVPTVAVAQ